MFQSASEPKPGRNRWPGLLVSWTKPEIQDRGLAILCPASAGNGSRLIDIASDTEQSQTNSMGLSKSLIISVD